MRKIIVLISILVLSVAFTACKKHEEKQQLPAGHPPMEGGMPQQGGMPNVPSTQNMPKVERKVVVSDAVKAKWKAVKIAVENKKEKSTKEYTVNIGSELSIPNTKLTLKVLHFLPDFKMTDKEFMSASDQPNMPAAQVAVFENGKEIWNNWLFALQPTIHPFQHDTVGLRLVAGVPK